MTRCPTWFDKAGGRWPDDALTAMIEKSSPEWSAYLHDELGVPTHPDAISREVMRRTLDGYRRELPLLPGAADAVRALSARWPLGLASSSNREVIDLVLELAGFADSFREAVSSEEVDRGKPAPDVYLTVAERLRADPERCGAIEDSSNGLRAAARMAVIAVPNSHYPPDDDALSLASATVTVVGEITPELPSRSRREGRASTTTRARAPGARAATLLLSRASARSRSPLRHLGFRWTASLRSVPVTATSTQPSVCLPARRRTFESSLWLPAG